MTEDQRRQWRKITYGLSDGPVRGGLTLASAKKPSTDRKVVSCYERVRRAEGLRRRREAARAAPFCLNFACPHGTAAVHAAEVEEQHPALQALYHRATPSAEPLATTPNKPPSPQVQQLPQQRRAKKMAVTVAKAKPRKRTSLPDTDPVLTEAELEAAKRQRSKSLPANYKEAAERLQSPKDITSTFSPTAQARTPPQQQTSVEARAAAAAVGDASASDNESPRPFGRKQSVFNTDTQNRFKVKRRTFSLFPGQEGAPPPEAVTPAKLTPSTLEAASGSRKGRQSRGSSRGRGRSRDRSSRVSSGGDTDDGVSDSAWDDDADLSHIPDYASRYPPRVVMQLKKNITEELNAELVRRAAAHQERLIEVSGIDAKTYGVVAILEAGETAGNMIMELTEEELEKAAAALEADQACENNLLVDAMRHLLLAHTAYRVPTGSEFWDRVKSIQSGVSHADPAEVLKKYRRDAAVLSENVADFLRRIRVCTGRTLALIATTQLDQKLFEDFLGVDVDASDWTVGGTFAKGVSVLSTPPSYEAVLIRIDSHRAQDGSVVDTFTVEDAWGRVREAAPAHVRPKRGLREWDRVSIPVSGQRGVVMGAARGRVGVRVDGTDYVYGHLQQDVVPDASVYSIDDELIVWPDPLIGVVSSESTSRGRVSVKPFNSDDKHGCLPDTLRRRKDLKLHPALWDLILSEAGGAPVDSLRLVCQAGKAMHDEERAKEDEDRIKHKELPAVAPGWLMIDDQTEGAARGGDASVTISIAGTQNLNDCFRDCMFIPVQMEIPPYAILEDRVDNRKPTVPPDFEGLKAHMGFLDGATRIFQQILPELIKKRTELQEKDKAATVNLTLTGHSLGGATALILGSFLNSANIAHIKVKHIYTFGAPNVFNIKDWDPNNKNKGKTTVLRSVSVHQYVNEKDLVPRSLGSSAIRKVAKVGIKLGFKALKCVTSENAESLPFYRFTSDVLHHITKKAEKVNPLRSVKDQMSVLGLSLMGFRPQAAQDHKMSEYIANLKGIYDKETGYTHEYSLEPQYSATEMMHPILTACFDKEEPTKVSSSLQEALTNIFQRMGGINLETLSTLCFWSEKVYPVYLMHDVFGQRQAHSKKGGTTLASDDDDRSSLAATTSLGRAGGSSAAASVAALSAGPSILARAAPKELTLEGFVAFVEDQCYSDICWVARILSCMGWVPDGDCKLKLLKKTPEGQRNVKDVPDEVPIFYGTELLVADVESGSKILTPAAERVVHEIFDSYSRRVMLDQYSTAKMRRGSWSWSDKMREGKHKAYSEQQYLRPECIGTLIRNIEKAETGTSGPELAEDKYYQLYRAFLDNVPSLPSCLDPSTNFVTSLGFHEVFQTWCVDDELRMWNVLRKGGGYGEQLTLAPGVREKGELPLWDTDALDKTASKIDRIIYDENKRREKYLGDQLRLRVFQMFIAGKEYVSPVQQYQKRKSVPAALLRKEEQQPSPPPKKKKSAVSKPELIARARRKADRLTETYLLRRLGLSSLVPTLRVYAARPYAVEVKLNKRGGGYTASPKASGGVSSTRSAVRTRGEKPQIPKPLQLYLKPLPVVPISCPTGKLESPRKIVVKRSVTGSEAYKHV